MAEATAIIPKLNEFKLVLFVCLRTYPSSVTVAKSRAIKERLKTAYLRNSKVESSKVQESTTHGVN